MCATSSQSLYIVPIPHTYFLFLFFIATFLFGLAPSLPLILSISTFLLFSHLSLPLTLVYRCHFLVTFCHSLFPSSCFPLYLFQLLPSALSLNLFSSHQALLCPYFRIAHPSVHPFLSTLYPPSLCLSLCPDFPAFPSPCVCL